MASNRNQRNKPEPKPEPQAKFKLRPVEMVGIGLLLFIVLIYMFRSCGGNNNTTTTTANNNTTDSAAATPNNATPANTQLRPLYVVIDSIKLRPKPQLDSTFIRHLSYDEIVYDMGEQTNFVQTIRYSMDDVRTEPWVKIKTRTGEIGWVFGAGVSFYRKKRTGVPNVSVPNTTVTQPAAITTTRPSTPTTTTPSTPRRDTSRNLNRPINASGNR